MGNDLIELTPDFFCQWLKNIQPKLPVGLTRIRARRNYARFSFVGYPKQIVGIINYRGIRLDGLDKSGYDEEIENADIELLIKQSDEGFYCYACPERKYYATAEELWHAHQFGLFCDMLSETLIPARFLAFVHDISDGKTRWLVVLCTGQGSGAFAAMGETLWIYTE